MSVGLTELVRDLNLSGPAPESAIREFQSHTDVQVPADYLNFLRKNNGGEGFVGRDARNKAYVILWTVEELIELNRAYQVDQYAPGLFLFGSDGGGEAFAFDMRTPEKVIVKVPFVGMAVEEAVVMGGNFLEFLNNLYES